MEKKNSKQFYDQIVQELYHRDLRQYSGLDKEEEALAQRQALQQKEQGTEKPSFWARLVRIHS